MSSFDEIPESNQLKVSILVLNMDFACQVTVRIGRIFLLCSGRETEIL